MGQRSETNQSENDVMISGATSSIRQLSKSKARDDEVETVRSSVEVSNSGAAGTTISDDVQWLCCGLTMILALTALRLVDPVQIKLEAATAGSKAALICKFKFNVTQQVGQSLKHAAQHGVDVTITSISSHRNHIPPLHLLYITRAVPPFFPVFGIKRLIHSLPTSFETPHLNRNVGQSSGAVYIRCSVSCSP